MNLRLNMVDTMSFITCSRNRSKRRCKSRSRSRSRIRRWTGLEEPDVVAYLACLLCLYSLGPQSLVQDVEHLSSKVEEQQWQGSLGHGSGLSHPGLGHTTLHLYLGFLSPAPASQPCLLPPAPAILLSSYSWPLRQVAPPPGCQDTPGFLLAGRTGLLVY